VGLDVHRSESGERATLEVRAANTAFYEAFDTQDIAAMRRVWGRGDHVQCMHPGSANVIGSDSVLRSWEVIMQAAGGGGQRMGVHCTSVRVHISHTMAYVTCEEAVGTDEPGFGLYATNVFEKQNDEWKMVLHQAAVARV
jgi:ketosteroid isomerase-like protein